MQLEECLAEASREGRSRLCDAALCTCQLSREAREEVVLGLLWCQDRYWRQYAEGVCRQEDNLLCCRSRRTGLDVIDVEDWVRNTRVLSYALISEINLNISSHSYVLEESVALDRDIDI